MLTNLLSASSSLSGMFTDDPLVLMILYFTLALAAVGLIIGVLVRKFSADKFRDYTKTLIGICLGYSIAVVVIMSYLSIDTELGFAKDGIVPLLFYPLLAVVLIALCGGFAAWICSLFSKKAVKIAGITTAALEAGAFVAVMVCMSVFYEAAKNDPAYAEETWIDFSTVNSIGLIVSGIVFILIAAVIYFLGNKTKQENNTRALAYGAVAIAMSFALSYIRFYKMPQGGSLTFASLLPLMIYCCMFGTRRGVVACLIYGVLQAIQDPFILHPMQFLLDYPLAFGMIGISGIFVEKGVFKNVKGGKTLAFVCGAVLGVLLRYACHVCSGVFAFASYADLDSYTSVAVYSLAYNSFAFADMLICIVAGVLLLSSRTFVNQMQRAAALPVETADGTDVEDVDGFYANADNDIENEAGAEKEDGTVSVTAEKTDGTVNESAENPDGQDVNVKDEADAKDNEETVK